jgi:hypothetical protein
LDESSIRAGKAEAIKLHMVDNKDHLHNDVYVVLVFKQEFYHCLI